VETTIVDGQELSYRLCRVLPDTALMLRDVLREAARLWTKQLGAERYDEIRSTPEGEDFFTGRVRLEPVPPEREMVAVWLPFPAGFSGLVKPQLIDAIEPFDSSPDVSQPPSHWHATDGGSAS